MRLHLSRIMAVHQTLLLSSCIIHIVGSVVCGVTLPLSPRAITYRKDVPTEIYAAGKIACPISYTVKRMQACAIWSVRVPAASSSRKSRLAVRYDGVSGSSSIPCSDGDHVMSFMQRINNDTSARGWANWLRRRRRNLFLEINGNHMWIVLKYSFATALLAAKSPIKALTEDGMGKSAVGSTA